MTKPKLVLGIETSCDETSAAIVNSDKQILSNIVLSQIEEHRLYGGVVPELAARMHVGSLDRVIELAMKEAGVNFSDIDAVAATCGPGLIGGVMVGAVTGKAIAASLRIPFIAINHLEAHILTSRLTSNIEFPMLFLLVSGGHTILGIAHKLGKYQILGQTIDDAAGEAFDKTAKMLGLLYPGGQIIEQKAKLGDDSKFSFPVPLRDRDNCDFSFSGLKTSVLRLTQMLGADLENNIDNICASFQKTIADIFVIKLERAIREYRKQLSCAPSDSHLESEITPFIRPKEADKLVFAGGVAANLCIRERLEKVANKFKMSIVVPPINLCTDNAAMIAWSGVERLNENLLSPLNFKPRAKWPIDNL